MQIVKSAALSALAAGFKIPENSFCRYVELTYLGKLLRILDINCVLDVGANRGQFATELRQIGYRGYIFSFEPIQQEFAVLGSVFRNDDRWKGYQIALGSENGVAEINVLRDMTVMSSILKPIGKQKNVAIEKVEVKRLDGLLPGLLSTVDHPRVFLKMDTQGYDLEVFKGVGDSRRILGLQSEICVTPQYQGMPLYLEALATYERAGFQLFNLATVARTPSGGLVELNCLMKRAAVPPLNS